MTDGVNGVPSGGVPGTEHVDLVQHAPVRTNLANSREYARSTMNTTSSVA